MNLLNELKHDAAGIAILTEWLGSGGTPVAKELAESRAAVCVPCEKHRKFKWWEIAKHIIAEFITACISLKNRLNISTSRDDELFMCGGCKCCCRLKVHVDIKHILAHTNDETMRNLAPDCWILREAKP